MSICQVEGKEFSELVINRIILPGSGLNAAFVVAYGFEGLIGHQKAVNAVNFGKVALRWLSFLLTIWLAKVYLKHIRKAGSMTEALFFHRLNPNRAGWLRGESVFSSFFGCFFTGFRSLRPGP